MKTTKTYYVRWFRDGYNYRDTSNVPFKALKELRKTAKMLGEKILIEVE